MSMNTGDKVWVICDTGRSRVGLRQGTIKSIDNGGAYINFTDMLYGFSRGSIKRIKDTMSLHKRYSEVLSLDDSSFIDLNYIYPFDMYSDDDKPDEVLVKDFKSIAYSSEIYSITFALLMTSLWVLASGFGDTVHLLTEFKKMFLYVVIIFISLINIFILFKKVVFDIRFRRGNLRKK